MRAGARTEELEERLRVVIFTELSSSGGGAEGEGKGGRRPEWDTEVTHPWAYQTCTDVADLCVGCLPAPRQASTVTHGGREAEVTNSKV